MCDAVARTGQWPNAGAPRTSEAELGESSGETDPHSSVTILSTTLSRALRNAYACCSDVCECLPTPSTSFFVYTSTFVVSACNAFWATTVGGAITASEVSCTITVGVTRFSCSVLAFKLGSVTGDKSYAQVGSLRPSCCSLQRRLDLVVQVSPDNPLPGLFNGSVDPDLLVVSLGCC